MMRTSPFDWIVPSAQKRAFVALLILTLLLIVSMQALGGPLKTSAAPAGIVSFEFAGTLDLADEIVDSWGTRARMFAGLSLGLDYLFILSYAACVGLGCVLVSRALSARSRILASLGVVLAWTQILAGLLDALENYALVRVLLGSAREYWPAVARWCAIPKFILVAIGIVFAISVALFLAGGELLQEKR